MSAEGAARGSAGAAAGGDLGGAETGRPAAVLCGLGSWLPPVEVPNEQLCDRLGVTAAWIEQRIGVRSRRRAASGTATVAMAVEAGARALKSQGHARVDAVLLATVTSDHLGLAGAPEVAAELGLTGAAAFDVSAACAGFLHGLSAAAGYLAAGTFERVLVIGADTMSALLDPDDPGTAPIFGDGAGAAVLRAGDAAEPGARPLRPRQRRRAAPSDPSRRRRRARPLPLHGRRSRALSADGRQGGLQTGTRPDEHRRTGVGGAGGLAAGRGGPVRAAPGQRPDLRRPRAQPGASRAQVAVQHRTGRQHVRRLRPPAARPRERRRRPAAGAPHRARRLRSGPGLGRYQHGVAAAGVRRATDRHPRGAPGRHRER